MPTTLEQLQYGFDRDSRRTWRQRATTQGWDNAYAYDSLSQVTGDDRGDLNLAQNTIAGIPANGARWDYDETGNWQGYQTTSNGSATLTQSRTHDKGNRLMEVEGAAAMRTDRAGRVVQAVPGPQQNWSQSWQITWDAWSRITQVSHVEGNEIHRYGYDGITRRITRTNNQTGVTLRSYYNDQWRPVEERKNSETTASASFLWGARHRDDLVRRDRAVGGTALNETRYILMDYFSPAAITDAAGAVKERYQFSAFGLRTILNPDFTPRTSSECGMEFSFQGQFEDLETGWMNYGYRYFFPQLGRWSRKDPIGLRGGLNLFASSDNSLINFVDHLGLAKIDATTECPDPNSVPVEKTYGGSSGTSYPDQSVTCECAEGDDTSVGAKKDAKCWSVKKCTIKFNAKITVSFAQARDTGTPHWKIFGHEQRHVQSRCKRVKNVVESLIKSKDGGRQSSEASCNTYKKSIEDEGKAKLAAELDHDQSPDHKGDPGTTEFSPGDQEGLDPLPGTTGDYSRYTP